jgi:hypothetical protein
MKFSSLAMAIILAAGLTAACNSSSPQSDDRTAELEKRLAETEQQLAEVTEKNQQPTPPDAAAPPAPQPQPSKPQRPPGSSEQQRAVNAQQAETNARLQDQVEKLKPREFVLPVGTVVPIRTISELSTAQLSSGSVFEAHLEHDLKSGETVLAPARSRVTGFVVSSDPGGRVKGTASLTIGVRSIVGAKGNVMSVSTDSQTFDAESTKKKDAVRTGVATGVGAIIGGTAGGGSGAAKGAGAGAAAGVGLTLATRGAAAVLPAESLIEFRLTSPLTVVMQP